MISETHHTPAPEVAGESLLGLIALAIFAVVVAEAAFVAFGGMVAMVATISWPSPSPAASSSRSCGPSVRRTTSSSNDHDPRRRRSRRAGARGIAFARVLADAEAADLQHVSARRGESAAQLLHQRADESDAQLVVLGSSHTGRFGRVVPGGTGERLLHGSPCAVAIVPRAHPGGVIARIGVAYDASPEADAALEHATDLARHLHAAVELIGVVTPDPYEEHESAHSLQLRSSAPCASCPSPSTASSCACTASRPRRSPATAPSSTCSSPARAATARCAR